MPPTAARRVLIVSAAMGGGHLAISRELQRRLERRGHEVMLVDQLDAMPRPTGKALERLYPLLVNRTPGLYQLVYDVFFVAEQRAGERVGVPVRLALPGLRRTVRSFSPDVAVGTHPLCSVALGELRGEGSLRCPAVTLVTTFSLNTLWLHPEVDLEICISADAAADAQRRTGRPAAVSGPVVRPGFQPAARADGEHRPPPLPGVQPGTCVALVSTGSVGLAGAALQAAAALARHPRWTPVVLCGRSERLRQRVERLPGAVAMPWVADMAGLLERTDVLVDNAGGMSAKEALGAGVPVVTFRPLSGHGRDDAAALLRLGVTDVVHDDAALVAAVERLRTDPEHRRERVSRGRRLFVADVADLVLQAAS